MAAPEYLVCLECETPCYTFEWQADHALEAGCEACGNDDPERFMPPDDFEDLASIPPRRR